MTAMTPTSLPQSVTGAPAERGLSPARRDLWAIAIVAILIRILVAGGAWLTVTPRSEWSGRARDFGDAPSYIAQAKAMCGDNSTLTDFDRRVFPGYPALIALAHVALRLPFHVAALLLPWSCAGLAAALAAALFNDRRIGWAMALLIPHYLSYSAMPMSEAPLLAMTLGGMVLARRWAGWAVVLGAVLMGFGGTIRPVACFAVAGVLVCEWLRGRRGAAVVIAVVAGATVGAAIGLLHWWTGDAFHGVHVYANDKAAYNGQIFTWPFHSLIATPRSPDLPFLKKGKIAYVYIHVVLALTACALLVRRCYAAWSVKNTPDLLDALSLVWLAANTLFVLCVGSKWGFFAFARFTVPALPAAFWAYRPILPRRWWPWALIALPSIVIAIDSVKRMN